MNVDEIERALYPPKPPTKHRRGERHWKAKLTAAAVVEIRRAHRAGEQSQAALAARFGVTQVSVSNVLRRRTWRHVP